MWTSRCQKSELCFNIALCVLLFFFCSFCYDGGQGYKTGFDFQEPRGPQLVDRKSGWWRLWSGRPLRYAFRYAARLAVR